MKLNKTLVLASSSPRRQFLMKQAGFDFEVLKPEVDEIFPEQLPPEKVAGYLASLKAGYFRNQPHGHIYLTADTVVILDGRILNKPVDRNDALNMLSSLSGQTHTVMTGVCILVNDKETLFDDTTKVTFRNLSPEEVEFYVDTFQPFDKAGAYGAQDCLPAGLNPCSEEEMQFLRSIGKESLVEETLAPSRSGNRSVLIEKITGSYFNVMGLPVHKVYNHLKNLSNPVLPL